MYKRTPLPSIGLNNEGRTRFWIIESNDSNLFVMSYTILNVNKRLFMFSAKINDNGMKNTDNNDIRTTISCNVVFTALMNDL